MVIHDESLHRLRGPPPFTREVKLLTYRLRGPQKIILIYPPCKGGIKGGFYFTEMQAEIASIRRFTGTISILLS